LHFWLYAQLVVLTFGTLLPLFWMIVILGHRRQRNFERVLFFQCLLLFLFFGGSLLEVNARLYYTSPPEVLSRFCWVVVSVALFFLPSVLLHLHLEYAQIRQPFPITLKRACAIALYLPALVFAPKLYGAVELRAPLDWMVPSRALGAFFPLWLALALVVAAASQALFARSAPDRQQGSFHRAVSLDLSLLAVLIGVLHLVGPGTREIQMIYTGLGLLALLPLGALIRNVHRFNFLQIGRQQNLIYAVFAVFLALLYLSFVRRIGTWTEVYLPPEATAAILLFLPVLFFEPLQRLMRRLLQTTAKAEVDRANRLMGPVLEVARLGDSEKLRRFAEEWITRELQLAEASLAWTGTPVGNLLDATSHGARETFVIRQGRRDVGTLEVRGHGAMLSGETFAALQFISEQLPGALDLCRLIEEKLRLERELAERERLALLGHMAASISHNLKNPLGAMKTILQLQLENPAMPESLRPETKMVLDEVRRLSLKLSQLLEFSRPAVRGGEAAAWCDCWSVAERVVNLLRPEAERRGVRLELISQNGPINARVNVSGEALNDILSNLIVNAIEAGGPGGRVSLSAGVRAGLLNVQVEDDGPGIPKASRDKVLQPFFTTKSQGTGLGLAIVARRVAEARGELRWESPVCDGRGTRFEVLLRLDGIEEQRIPGIEQRGERDEKHTHCG
jgi:signal transduction histidine kinase